MMKVKHLMDAVEPDDGQRLWVEAGGLTKDLREWCNVSHVLPHLGPTSTLATWFEQHPDGYEYFRARYHEALARSPYKAALQTLVKSAAKENFTLLHMADDPNQNAAAALHEYLTELGAWSAEKEG